MNFSLYLFQPQRNPPTPNDGETQGGFLSDAARDRVEPQIHSWEGGLGGGGGVCPHPFSSPTPTKRWKCRCTRGCKGTRVHGEGGAWGIPARRWVRMRVFHPFTFLPSAGSVCFPNPNSGSTREAAKRFRFVSFRATRVV